MPTGLVENRNTKSQVWHYLLLRKMQTESQKTLTSLSASCVKRRSWPISEIQAICTHVRNKHPTIYTDSAKERQGSSNSTWGKDSTCKLQLLLFLKKANKLDWNSTERKELTKAITVGLVKDMLPLSTIDKPAFRAKLSPRYDWPTTSR